MSHGPSQRFVMLITLRPNSRNAAIEFAGQPKEKDWTTSTDAPMGCANAGAPFRVADKTRRFWEEVTP
jgi:hypothetical protein